MRKEDAVELVLPRSGQLSLWHRPTSALNANLIRRHCAPAQRRISVPVPPKRRFENGVPCPAAAAASPPLPPLPAPLPLVLQTCAPPIPCFPSALQKKRTGHVERKPIKANLFIIYHEAGRLIYDRRE